MVGGIVASRVERRSGAGGDNGTSEAAARQCNVGGCWQSRASRVRSTMQCWGDDGNGESSEGSSAARRS